MAQHNVAVYTYNLPYDHFEFVCEAEISAKHYSEVSAELKQNPILINNNLANLATHIFVDYKHLEFESTEMKASIESDFVVIKMNCTFENFLHKTQTLGFLDATDTI
ncbi:hypothetical protein GGI00_003784, partial [Coemansia sp. RSA 2681]